MTDLHELRSTLRRAQADATMWPSSIDSAVDVLIAMIDRAQLDRDLLTPTPQPDAPPVPTSNTRIRTEFGVELFTSTTGNWAGGKPSWQWTTGITLRELGAFVAAAEQAGCPDTIPVRVTLGWRSQIHAIKVPTRAT